MTTKLVPFGGEAEFDFLLTESGTHIKGWKVKTVNVEQSQFYTSKKEAAEAWNAWALPTYNPDAHVVVPLSEVLELLEMGISLFEQLGMDTNPYETLKEIIKQKYGLGTPLSECVRRGVKHESGVSE